VKAKLPELAPTVPAVVTVGDPVLPGRVAAEGEPEEGLVPDCVDGCVAEVVTGGVVGGVVPGLPGFPGVVGVVGPVPGEVCPPEPAPPTKAMFVDTVWPALSTKATEQVTPALCCAGDGGQG